MNRVRKEDNSHPGWFARNAKPFMWAGMVMFILLFLNYNELFIAQIKQFVSPGNSLNSPIIVDPNAEVNIGNDPRIIIPKINVDVPVVYDIKTFDESQIQAGLERGVVHYGDTAVPGKPGNVVIVGHSSNNFFNAGKYKFAFVLLERLDVGDTFILHYKGTRYIYKIVNKQIIEPTDFSLIEPTAKPSATLITCTPPGTSWHRLVVQGEQISPTPTTKAPSKKSVTPEGKNSVVPGNSPTLLNRFFDWLFSLFGGD
jgi:sortase A